MVPVSASNVNTNLLKGQQNLTPNHLAFKNLLWLEPVPRCEPSTYQPITQWHSQCTIGSNICFLCQDCNLFKDKQNLTPTHWAFKTLLSVGAGTEMWTQYLPNDIASAPSGPVSASYVKTVIY